MRPNFLRWLWLAIPAVFALTSCEVPYDADLQSLAPSLVIEGVVTDEDTTQYVYLTLNQAYTNNASPVTVSGAVVTISDDDGNSYVLPEVSPGRYETEAFTGVTGNVYTLTVLTDGDTYTAVDTLKRQHIADSISYRLYDKDNADDDVDTTGYYITTTSRDPEGKGDYIYYRFFKNGDRNANTLGNIRVFSDDAIQEDFPIVAEWNGVFRYDLGDTAVVEILSISELAFNYYTDIQAQDGGGSPFAGPAFNPRTNIKGGARGFFRCSGVARLRAVIEE